MGRNGKNGAKLIKVIYENHAHNFSIVVLFDDFNI